MWAYWASKYRTLDRFLFRGVCVFDSRLDEKVTSGLNADIQIKFGLLVLAMMELELMVFVQTNVPLNRPWSSHFGFNQSGDPLSNPMLELQDTGLL